MSVQAEREDAEEEERIQTAFFNFSRQMQNFSNRVLRITRAAEQSRAAGEPSGGSWEDPVIQQDLSFIREKAAVFTDISDLPQSRRYPNAKLYLMFWEPALLGSNYTNPVDLSEIVTICGPLANIETGLSCKETMARLEENVTSGEYQEALDLLGIGDLVPTTTQGGT